MMLKVSEAAVELGVSESTLFGLLKAGKIRSVLLGPKIRRIPRTELEAYVQRLLDEQAPPRTKNVSRLEGGEKCKRSGTFSAGLQRGTKVKRFAITILATAGLVLGLGLAGAGSALASPAMQHPVSPAIIGPAVFTSSQEAGQLIQSSGTEYRYEQEAFVVTPALGALVNDPTSNIFGAVGGELCNNTTGRTLQFGIIPSGTPGVYDLASRVGYLTNNPKSTTHDSCATGGVLTPPYDWASHGIGSWNQVATGDTVQTAAYYDASSGWVTFIVSDPNQGGVEDHSFFIGKWAKFTEAGAGVFDTEAENLSAPADIPFVNFFSVSATTVSGKRGGLDAAGRLSESVAYNTGGSASLAPADLLQPTTLVNTGNTNSFIVNSANPAS